MRTEGLDHLNISKDPTGNRARNLPSCGPVPQPTAAALNAHAHLSLLADCITMSCYPYAVLTLCGMSRSVNSRSDMLNCVI